MKIVPWSDFIKGNIRIPGQVSATTGVFDGVHLGHCALIRRLTSEEGTCSVLSTFSSNPFKFFFPERYLGDILTLEQKTERIDTLGVDYLLLIDFSADFSKLSGRVFFHLLREHLDLRHLVLGKNHRCGHRGDTGAEEARAMLEPLGTTVDIIEPLVIDGHPVSSTRIREAVTAGDMEKAEKLIGRPYSIDLRNTRTTGTGCRVTIRRGMIGQLIPKAGRYICRAENKHERTAVSAVLEIDDRILNLNMEKELEATGINFLHKDDRKDEGDM